jgi:hypothetical protein
MTRQQVEDFIAGLGPLMESRGFFSTPEEDGYDHLPMDGEVSPDSRVFAYCPLGDEVENCFLIMGDLGVTWTPEEWSTKEGGGHTEALAQLELTMTPDEVADILSNVWKVNHP